MKHLVLTLTSWAALLAPKAALAIDTCYVNGEAVPCPDISGATGAAFVAMPILFGLVGIAMFVFWVMMLIHAIKNPIGDKVLWIIVLIIGGIIGALIYYFAVKRHFKPAPVAAAAPPPPASPPPPPAAPVA